MPEHLARHDAPANQLGAPTDLGLERLIAGDADGLADVLGLASARMLLRELEHHGLTPVAPRDSLR
jgi:hypothetical protein